MRYIPPQTRYLIEKMFSIQENSFIAHFQPSTKQQIWYIGLQIGGDGPVIVDLNFNLPKKEWERLRKTIGTSGNKFGNKGSSRLRVHSTVATFYLPEEQYITVTNDCMSFYLKKLVDEVFEMAEASAD